MTELTRQVDLNFTEDEARTRADAVLELRGERFHGFGQAKRAPQDPNVPLVGEERIDNFPQPSGAPDTPR